MTEPHFGRGQRRDLPYGLRLRSVGVAGRIGQARRAGEAGTRGGLPELLAGDGVPEAAATAVGETAEQAGMRRRVSLPLYELSLAPRTEPHLELEVPAPAADEAQAVLEVDATGVLRWHFPEPVAEERRRAGTGQLFRIPMVQVDLRAQERGIAGYGLRKVLHLIRFPVEAVGARAAVPAVAWWEDRRRRYGLHLATRTLDHGADGEVVAADRLAELGDKPFLLLVHGTFSRGRDAFRDLTKDPAWAAEIHDRYAGRVLVFDHPTLHESPAENAAWLLDRLPKDRPITLDVVAHSRGGLVARCLAGAGSNTKINNLVHVATPNAGTVLASRDRFGDLLDAFTNAFSLVPDTPVTTVLEGVLEVVKQLATGAFGGLSGLSAMDPAGDWLRTINAEPPKARTYAVTSDFGPDRPRLSTRAVDAVADLLFGAANDLVVPTTGVYDAGGYRVDAPMTVPRDVSHSTYFAKAEVRSQLAGWLR